MILEFKLHLCDHNSYITVVINGKEMIAEDGMLLVKQIEWEDGQPITGGIWEKTDDEWRYTLEIDDNRVKLKDDVLTIKRVQKMKSRTIEKQWEYKGYECIVTYTPQQVIEDYRCGYVCLHDNDVINSNKIGCHGGITWFGYHDEFEKSCIGFDCAHYGDTLAKCTLEYCVEECEKIVDQILEVNNV